MPTDEFKKVEWLRWGLLRAAEATGAGGITFEWAQYTVSSDFHWPAEQISKNLHYLIERDLLRAEETPQNKRYFVTNHGQDFVDGTIAPRPGIARPPIESLIKK